MNVPVSISKPLVRNNVMPNSSMPIPPANTNKSDMSKYNPMLTSDKKSIVRRKKEESNTFTVFLLVVVYLLPLLSVENSCC